MIRANAKLALWKDKGLGQDFRCSSVLCRQPSRASSHSLSGDLDGKYGGLGEEEGYDPEVL